MKNKELLELLFKEKLVGIFRGVPLEVVAPSAKAIAEGGLKFIELTYNQCSTNPEDDLKAQMDELRSVVGEEVHIGVGTVLTVKQTEWARRIGAEYIVSPITKTDVIKRSKELGLISIPGANSPTEINLAYESGADLVKLYTVDNVKEVKYLMGPLGHIPMQITCGATVEAIPDFLKAGIKCFGTRTFVSDELLLTKNYAGMTDVTKQFVNAVRGNM